MGHFILPQRFLNFFPFFSATHILTSQTKSNRGNLIGFSAAGLPLYNFTGDKLSKTSNSLLLFAKNGLRQILEDSDSRKIFYFLCVNLVSGYIVNVFLFNTGPVLADITRIKNLLAINGWIL